MILADEEATARAGAALAAVSKAGDIITLSGPLGAGKTTFARGFLVGLGHQGEVPSPSFSIVQPYDDLDPPAWHVDLFRVEDPRELDELGLDSATEAILLVEWPERAGNAAWPNVLRLTLDVIDPSSRSLTANVPAAWEGRWPFP